MRKHPDSRHQFQRDTVCRRSCRHGAVLLCGFRFQLLARGIVRHGKLRSGLCRQGEVRVHQRQPPVRKVEGIGTAVILLGLKHLRPRNEGVGFGQQPEDARGHQDHGSGTGTQKKHPVTHQPQTAADTTLAAGRLRGSAAGGSLILLHNECSLLTAVQNCVCGIYRHNLYYTPLFIGCKRKWMLIYCEALKRPPLERQLRGGSSFLVIPMTTSISSFALLLYAIFRKSQVLLSRTAYRGWR